MAPVRAWRDVAERQPMALDSFGQRAQNFLAFIMEDPRSITACVHLPFIAKNFERMGDHVTAIAEQAIYLSTGKVQGDTRQKADRASFDAAGAGKGANAQRRRASDTKVP